MIKQGLKNFLKNLSCVFTPLGTMFLGMMIGFSVLIPGVLSAGASLVGGMKELSDNVNLDFYTLLQDVWAAVRALDWDAPLQAIKTLLSSAWWHDTLTQVLNSILGTDYESFAEQVAELVGSFISNVVHYVRVFFVCWGLGFVAGFFLVKLRIRRTAEKGTIWKILLATVLHAVLMTALVILSLVLLLKWGWSIAVSTPLIIVLVSAYCLTEAYFIYGRKKVPFKRIVNAKNTGVYALTCLMIFLIAACFVVIGCLINLLMGLFIGLAILEIAIIVINRNADLYVQSVVLEAQNKE